MDPSTEETSIESVVQPESVQSVDTDVSTPAREETSENDDQNPRPPLPARPTTVREIHKNSWVKRFPNVERKPSRFTKTPKPEKVWMVFCVHNDKEPILEFYENRRSAYSHNPLTSVSLINCLHISPSIFPQEDEDHEFVITLDTQIIRIAAASREQMIEWMDIIRMKLREMSILEPKDNIYSREPGPIRNDSVTQYIEPSHETGVQDLVTSTVDTEYQQLRNPNSPLPPVPPAVRVNDQSSSSSSILPNVQDCPSVLVNAPLVISPPQERQEDPSNIHTTTSSNIFNFDFIASSLSENAASPNLENGMLDWSPGTSTSNNRAFSLPTSPANADSESLYEPLFFTSAASSPNQAITSRGIRNPNYDNPPAIRQRRSESELSPTGNLSRHSGRSSVSSVSEITASSPHQVSSSLDNQISFRRQRTLRDAVSVSEPSLNIPRKILSNISPSRRVSVGSLPKTGPPPDQNNVHRAQRPASSYSVGREQPRSPRNTVVPPPPPPLEEGPPPYDGIVSGWNQVAHSPNSTHQGTSADSPLHNENGRPLSLKEAQVMKLQKEITHKSGVRLMLRKRDSVNAIAFVECFGAVWIAGWKQKEHPLLHNTFHIGDFLVSIAGYRVSTIQEAQKAIKHQPLIVEFVVNRVPRGHVLAIKREYDGQDLGLIRDGNTAEIKEVKADGLAFRHGLPPKAPSMDGNSMCNWVLTEINHRPLNLFFKDNEVLDRLNAVGRDISILVQPADLVKQLKKQLKLLRGYKDYIVQ